MAPSEALLGAPLVRPGEWRHPEINREIRNGQHERNERIDRVRARQSVYARQLYPGPRDAPRQFTVGELVLVRNIPGIRSVFGDPWSGPYPVIARRGETTYEVDRNGSRHIIHVDDMRPAPRRQPADPPEEDPFVRESRDDPGDVDDIPDEEHQGPVEPQPGPSSRPPDPAEFEAAASQQLQPASRPVQVEDWESDPGDLDEATPTPGLTPVVGLFP